MKIASLSIILSSLLLSIAAYMLYAGNKMATTHEPLIAISNNLEIEVTQAHLWLGEMVSGVNTASLERAWQQLSHVEWYARSLLEDNFHIISLNDSLLREQIHQMSNKLAKFGKITQQRPNKQTQSGSIPRLELHNVYQPYIKNVYNIEKKLHDKIQTDLTAFRKTGIGLLIAVALLAFLITKILLKNRQRDLKQIAKIKHAKQEIEEKNRKLRTMAHYDFLTNLPNRILLTNLLKTAIAKALKNEQWLVLFFIDLDHFKSVNNSFGHHAGDKLLQMVAERLRQLIRADDSVARLSGDEFTFLLSPENTQQQALDCADKVVKKIQKSLAESFYIEDTEIFISASIGIALYPKDGESVEDILKNADRSMYDVKQMGKNNYRFFSADLGDSHQRKLQLESDLRKAIINGELELYYQPQWNFKTGDLFGLEALVRWNHPQKGMLFPNEFIGVAENSGLIYLLDMWVLEAACKQLKQWEKEGLFSKQVSVNMSAIQFSSPSLVDNIISLLTQYDVKPDKLEIEIVESILMQDSEHTMTALAELKELGIHIAVDDFGTGYSAMAYLNKFPIDVLKIDKTFVSEIDSSIAAKVIIDSIIKMATRLNMTIVAEGIETEEQSQFLALHGCTFAQGYFYNKPMPVNDLATLLRVA